MKIKLIFSICLIMTIIFFAETSLAYENFNPFHVINQGDINSESVSNSFSVLTGGNVTISHNIFGTTVVFGENVKIDSEIDGDLICFGRNITLNGKVDGNLYMAGENVSLKGIVNRDSFVAGKNLTAEKECLLGRDAFLFGSLVDVYGEIMRDGNVFSESNRLLGKIGRNLNIYAENISVEKEAYIGGNLKYKSENNANISQGATIKDGVQKYNIPIETNRHKTPSPFKYLFDMLFTLGVTLVFWAALLIIAPNLLNRFAELLAGKTGKAAGIGAIALFSIPIACIFLLCTVIGIPLSLITLIAYALLMYLSFFISAGAFGIVMFKKVFKKNDFHNNIWYILAGVFVIKLLTMIPYIGWIFGFASLIFGFGLVLLTFLESRRIQA